MISMEPVCVELPRCCYGNVQFYCIQCEQQDVQAAYDAEEAHIEQHHAHCACNLCYVRL